MRRGNSPKAAAGEHREDGPGAGGAAGTRRPAVSCSASAAAPATAAMRSTISASWPASKLIRPATTSRNSRPGPTTKAGKPSSPPGSGRAGANAKDAVFVLSVGGGDAVRKVSANIVYGLAGSQAARLKIFGIVGRDGGYTKQIGDEVIVVPTVDKDLITPMAEAFQGVVWHALVSHPSAEDASVQVGKRAFRPHESGRKSIDFVCQHAVYRVNERRQGWITCGIP